MEIDYQTIYEYLHCRKHCKPEASYTKQSEEVYQGWCLHYIAKDRHRQWIRDADQQRKIIQACHADKLGGHFGRDKTRD